MRNEEQQRKRQAFIFSYIVTACWVVSFVVGIFNPKYQPPMVMHPLMLIVAGAFVTEGLRRPGAPPGPPPPPVHPAQPSEVPQAPYWAPPGPPAGYQQPPTQEGTTNGPT